MRIFKLCGELLFFSTGFVSAGDGGGYAGVRSTVNKKMYNIFYVFTVAIRLWLHFAFFTAFSYDFIFFRYSLALFLSILPPSLLYTAMCNIDEHLPFLPLNAGMQKAIKKRTSWKPYTENENEAKGDGAATATEQ